MRARPDIQIAVYLLYTRVREPENDDYHIMERAMKYIQGTTGLPLILSVKNPEKIKWYIDAAFAVHTDMMRYTGGFITTETQGSYMQTSK